MALDAASSVSGRIPDRHTTLTLLILTKDPTCRIIRIRPILGIDIVVRFIVGSIPLVLRSNIHVV
jgi:hypothetical protein